jgi:hypothetical protein
VKPAANLCLSAQTGLPLTCIVTDEGAGEMTRTIHILCLIACFVLMGCTATLTRAPSAGDMNDRGAIQPCSDRRDAQACGNAAFNATVISRIHKGQSRQDVRDIMGHTAEHTETEGLTESWGYLTSYRNQMLTWITFTDDKVSSFSHEQVRPD